MKSVNNSLQVFSALTLRMLPSKFIGMAAVLNLLLLILVLGVAIYGATTRTNQET